jgi:beta-lysine N6-acetyltransferase
MDLIAEQLISRHGRSLKGSRDTHTLEVAAPSGTIEVQYDPYNRRLKLFDLYPRDIPEVEAFRTAMTADEQADDPLYSKLIVYARQGQSGWEDFGLRREADIRGFFGNGDTAELWVRYTRPERAHDAEADHNDEVHRIATAKQPEDPVLPEGYACVPATQDDVPEIAELMSEIFPDYPTPITPEHVVENMTTAASYFRLVRDKDGELVACASAEIHHTRRSAELTDCATRADQRGKGLMSCILRGLERDLEAEFGITDVYTIARANQPGMNCSFAKLGYTYTGRLVNNCRMPEGWESMNVWCLDTSPKEQA